MKTELDYCDKCGVSIPSEYLRERNGLMLCPKCFREPDYPEDFGEWVYRQERDLFEEMAKRFKP